MGRRGYSTKNFNGSEVLTNSFYKQFQILRYVLTNGAAAFKIPFTPKGTTPGFEILFYAPSNAETVTSHLTLLGVYASAGYTDWRFIKRNYNNGGQMAYVYTTNSGSTVIEANYDYNGYLGFTQTFCVDAVNNVATKCDGTTQSQLPAHRQRYDYAGYIGIGNGWDGLNNQFFSSFGNYWFGFQQLILYKGPSISYNLIPVKRLSDAMIGMFDIQSQQFYRSETGTNFVAGPPL